MKKLKLTGKILNEIFLILLVILLSFWILTLALGLLKYFAGQLSTFGPSLIFSNPSLSVLYIFVLFYLWRFYRLLQQWQEHIKGRKSYSIRPIVPTDEGFLWEILYQSFYPFPSKASKLQRMPETFPISQYLKDWGKPDDCGFIAIDTRTRQPIGAAWFRLLTGDEKGYGYVDDRTPELMIAIHPEYQHLAIELCLLNHLLLAAKKRFESLSVQVSPGKPGWSSCPILGFKIVGETGTSQTLQKDLRTEAQVDPSDLLHSTEAYEYWSWFLKQW